MRDSQPLIDSLVADLMPIRPFKAGPIALTLWILGWLATIGLTLATGPLRPGALAQLTSTSPLSLEIVIGLLAGWAITQTAIVLAIPGRRATTWLWLSAATMIVWIGVYIAAIFVSTVEPSMLGKRAGCYLEVVAFAAPTLLLGAWLMRRGYVVSGWVAGAALGVAAGALPGLMMQLACMHEPVHILLYHLGPIAGTAAIGAGLGRLAFSRGRRATYAAAG